MLRPATEADIPALVALSEAHHPASHWSFLSFDPDKTAESFTAWIESDAATVLVGSGSFIVLLDTEPFFSTDTLAIEVMMYAPSGGGNALREAAKAWAADRAVPLMMSAEEPDRIEAKARWYRQDGFTPFSRNYIRRL